MSVVRQMPISLLIHSITYEEFVQGNGFDTEDGYKAEVTLSNIRIESISNIKRNSQGEELQYKALLFFDVVNSKASGSFEFKEKSRVIWDGKTIFVSKVNPIYAFSLHHWELELL